MLERLMALPGLWRWIVLLVLFAIITSVVAGSRVGAMLSQLKPPALPQPRNVEIANWDSGQNWTTEQSGGFHFKPQGSMTLNIPLSWFLALEVPADGTMSFLFGSKELFSSPAYLSRFGFVPQPVSKENPNGLPIGFAVSEYQNLPGISDAKTAIGFTCAACHTGQLVFENQRYLIEGGPAMIDLGQLTLAIGAAVGQTAVASNLPVLGGRFDRFARRVLGTRDCEAGRFQLKEDLNNVVKALGELPMGIDVTEGFARLDALNRIGNQVFAWDPGRDDNYTNIRAPVNFPHIWSASWFDWVQYDASIMRPLVRNAGEAMGTAAHTNFTAPVGGGRFSSSIPMANLNWIEAQLAGPDAPLDKHAFSGLRAPRWPEAFGQIDTAKADTGAALYEKHCKACHGPALTHPVAEGEAPADPFWDHFYAIKWQDDGVERQTSESYYKVELVQQDYIGTDPGQGNVLALRKVNTASGGTHADEMGIDRKVCIRDENGLRTARIGDAPMLAYPYALGATVQLAIDQFIATNEMDAEAATAFGRGTNRTVCRQVGVTRRAPSMAYGRPRRSCTTVQSRRYEPCLGHPVSGRVYSPLAILNLILRMSVLWSMLHLERTPTTRETDTLCCAPMFRVTAIVAMSLQTRKRKVALAPHSVQMMSAH